MLVLTIRTDKPEAEIGLYKDGKKLAYKAWLAHRQLAETLLTEINQLLASGDHTLQQDTVLKNSKKAGVEGLVCYRGPGSFTGLRIGLTVANTLAYSWGRPIVGETGKDWIKKGISRLDHGENETSTMPEYGAPVNITKQKK